MAIIISRDILAIQASLQETLFIHMNSNRRSHIGISIFWLLEVGIPPVMLPLKLHEYPSQHLSAGEEAII